MKRQLMFATFFISFSILMFELLFIRLLSTIFTPSLAFLGISFALFGLAFGGILVYFLPNYFSHKNFLLRLRSYSFYFALSMIGLIGFLLISHLHFINYRLVVISPIIPFLLANICLSLLFKYKNDIIDRLYFVDLLGAGVGVVLAVILMNILTALNVLFVATILAFIATAFLNYKNKIRGVIFIFIAFLSIFAIINHSSNIVELNVAFAKIDKKYNKILVSKWNSFSHITVSKLLYIGRSDKLLHIKIDGDAATQMYSFDGDFEKMSFLKKDISSLVFQITNPGKSLVIGSGGGRDVLMSVMFGHKVTGVDINPIINNLMKNEYRNYNGGLYHRDDVTSITAEGRSFIKQNNEKYDTISIPLVDTWASTAAGNLALVESYLYTVEAFEDYLKSLNKSGTLSISRWEMEGPRIISVFLEASKKLGINEPQKNIAIIQQYVPDNPDDKNGSLNNYLFKTIPFTKEELEKIYNFAEKTGFKILYIADGKNYENEQHSFLTSVDKEQYAKDYLKKNKKRMDPVYDNSPFFFFLTSFSDMNGIINGNLGITFMLVFVLSLTCVVLPIMINQKNKKENKNNKNVVAFLGYFGSLGLAFILIEMVMIQKFILYLEKPIYSYSVILASLLIFASIGSFLSKKINAENKKSFAKNSFIIFTNALIYSLFIDKIINGTMGWSISYKIFISGFITAPLAIFMGMMLPLGIKRLGLLNLDDLIPWTWAVNGALSVFATVLAIILAINIGLNAVLFIGGAIYLVALFFISLSKKI